MRVLVLASASPRRRALLEEAGLRFRVLPTRVPEEVPAGIPPSEVARSLALRKARAAAEGLGREEALVLAADTVVALDDGRILDKPRDRAEAGSHLGALSGTTHSVITAVCLKEIPAGAEEIFHVESRVTMRTLREEEIAAYAESGEGLDKAGGYAIQEGGDRFVTRVEGSRTNVVGLPVEEVLARLAARGLRP
jgi:septum formation protein